jgi:hypothetical protein
MAGSSLLARLQHEPNARDVVVALGANNVEGGGHVVVVV